MDACMHAGRKEGNPEGYEIPENKGRTCQGWTHEFRQLGHDIPSMWRDRRTRARQSLLEAPYYYG